MNLILFGIWDIPVSSYLLTYLSLGVLGFFLCYFHRFFAFVFIPLLIWLCISDFNEFYKYQVTPASAYVFQVVVAMTFAFSTTICGTILNWRKQKKPLK